MLKTLKTFDYHIELIETLLRAKVGAMAANVIAPLLLLFILYDQMPNNILLIVTLVQIVTFAIRMVIADKALKIIDKGDKNRIDKYLKYYLWMVFINSFLFGLSSIFAAMYVSELYMVILIALIFGITSGAMSTLTPVYHAIFIFITVTLSMVMLGLLFVGTTALYYIIAFLLFLYILITLPSAFKIYKSMDNNLKQREEIKILNASLEQRIEERTHQLSEKSKQLEELNKTLDQRVKDESERRHQNEQLLIQQSRQAAMGEMIGNIAHQWRQPLNALGLILQNIQFTYQMDDLSDEFMEKSVDKGKMLTTSMSKTIDDFRDFFKPNKLKENFSLDASIEKTVELIEASYKNNNIEVLTKLEENIEISGYPSEFSQVILNILSNAKDALVEHKANKRVVKIESFSEDKNAVITIEDNAGGIPQEIIEKIFNPYFTTKEEGKGTGIGLYMTKTIVEKNMGGKLSVENTQQGAKFTISIAL